MGAGGELLDEVVEDFWLRRVPVAAVGVDRHRRREGRADVAHQRGRVPLVATRQVSCEARTVRPMPKKGFPCFGQLLPDDLRLRHEAPGSDDRVGVLDHGGDAPHEQVGVVGERREVEATDVLDGHRVVVALSPTAGAGQFVAEAPGRVGDEDVRRIRRRTGERGRVGRWLFGRMGVRPLDHRRDAHRVEQGLSHHRHRRLVPTPKPARGAGRVGLPLPQLDERVECSDNPLDADRLV